jgi:hypothetical protein
MNVTAVLERANARKRSVLGTPDRYAGVRALWLKVIIRAIFDWVCYRDSTKLEKRKIADNAYTWLFEPSTLFNSFENLCQFLDISPEMVRERARSMSKEQIAKIEHLEREGSGEVAGARDLMVSGGDENEDA